MGIFKQLFGICETKRPLNEKAWTLNKDNIIEVDLNLMTELKEKECAVRLERRSPLIRVLLLKNQNGDFHAFENRCTHMGRRLDLREGQQKMKCCSVSGSCFDMDGNVTGGPAKKTIRKFNVIKEDNILKIEV